MSKESLQEKLGNDKQLIILQKIHLIIIIIGLIGATVGSLVYSESRLGRVEEDVRELKEKVEIIQEMKADIKYIQEGIRDIKEWQKRQEESIKEFYKLYKLEQK